MALRLNRRERSLGDLPLTRQARGLREEERMKNFCINF